jgi:hypothetical protein
MKWRSAASLRDRLAAWLTHPRLPPHLALLAVVLCLPALNGGWQLDDYFHRVVLRGDIESEYGPLELFSVMRHGPEVLQEFRDLGIFPWWSSETLRLAFLRYLSAATHWLDYRLWPESAVLQHAHSLLWLGGLVAAAALLYRRILGATWVAGLAALLYAVDDAHGAPAGWLANRNALIATFFGLLCLLAHDRWRRGEVGSPRGAALAALWFALALTAGEMGLGAFAYLLAYALVLDRGGPRQRLVSLAPYGMVLLMWAVIYRTFGFGAAGSGLYVDPGGQPLEFVWRLIERAPFYLTGQLTPLPAETWVLVPAEDRAGAWWMMAAALLVVVVVLAPLAARRREARFWAVGASLAVVPLCGTFPSNRVLFFVGLGAMGLVAQWLEGGWRGQGPRAGRWLKRAVTVGLVATHLVLAPLCLPVAAGFFKQFGEPATEAVLSLPDDDLLTAQELVVINAPDYLSYVSQAGSILLLHGRAMPHTVRGLAIGPSAVTVWRVDAHTLDLSMARGYFYGPFGPLFHDSLEPFAPGRSFEVPGMTATILDLTPAGPPATVRFRFDEPLEAAARRWVQFRNGRFEPFTPPAVGDAVELSAALGPLDLFAAEHPDDRGPWLGGSAASLSPNQ